MVGRHEEPLVDPALLRNAQLRGGLTMFFVQYLLQMGVFFLIPLYLLVALGLSAIATGVRIMPLSITLLAAALGIPRLFPTVSPRLVVRAGIFVMLLGMLVLLAAIDVKAGAEIVTVPLLLNSCRPAANRARSLQSPRLRRLPSRAQTETVVSGAETVEAQEQVCAP